MSAAAKLFVAVDLDEPARDFVAKAIEGLQAGGVDARFIVREKWHATLAFLGAVAPERFDAVAAAIETAARARASFELALDCVGAFPNRNRPRVVWIGSSLPQPEFAACAQAVRTALAAAGFAFDEDAVPHVTICRMKHRAAPLPEIALPGAVRVQVLSLTLYESVAVGGATKYVARKTLDLL